MARGWCCLNRVDGWMWCFSARSASLVQRGLQEGLLSERWGKVSLRIGKHPLQQDPQGLLEGPATQDVHGGTECHPDVGSPQNTLTVWV